MTVDFKSISIRRPQPEDLAALVAFWHPLWHASHAAISDPALVASRTPEFLKVRLDGMLQGVWLGEADGAICGFVASMDDNLNQLFVGEPHHGTGLSAHLLHLGERDIAARGVTQAQLECGVGNERARQFYLKQGWTDRGIEPYDAPTAEGAARTMVHRMEKTLSA